MTLAVTAHVQFALSWIVRAANADEFRLARGRAAYDRVDHAAAVTDFAAVTSTRSNDTYAHTLLASSYERLGRFDEALNQAELAVALDPRSAHVWATGGRIHLRQRREARAERGKG